MIAKCKIEPLPSRGRRDCGEPAVGVAYLSATDSRYVCRFHASVAIANGFRVDKITTRKKTVAAGKKT
jgi:hypothetical protein